MKKFLTIIVYTFVILLIGRNIVSLPRLTLFAGKESYMPALKKEVQNIIKGKKGNYGIFFADLIDNQTFGINEKEIFTAASVNKVPIIATLYYLENKGKINLDQQITLQKEDIQDYGTGSLRYEKPGSTYSLKTLAKLSLKQSDNTAAYILSQTITQETIQKTMRQFGLTQTSMIDNKTSPLDMYKLFKSLYINKITSESKSQELLGFMKDTDIEDRIPLLLPKDANVYHKTGDEVGFLHDVGIIENDKDTYFLAVMTSDIGNTEDKTKQTISRVSKHIIDFYDKRK